MIAQIVWLIRANRPTKSKLSAWLFWVWEGVWGKRFQKQGAHQLGCQRWQSRVADSFCYFWAVFSKRTFLTKSVVWKGAQQTLSIPPAAAEGLQVHFNMGASTMPRRVSQNPCSENASESNTSPSKKPGVYLEVWQADLLVGFAADFWAWLAEGRAPGGIFVFDWRIFRQIFCFGGFFFCILRPKNPPQNPLHNPPLPWWSFGRSSTVGWTPDRPWANSKFSTGTLPEIGTRFVCPLFFATSEEFLEHGNCSSGNPKTGRL